MPILRPQPVKLRWISQYIKLKALNDKNTSGDQIKENEMAGTQHAWEKWEMHKIFW